MSYKKKLIALYDKVGGISAPWIETFKKVTEVHPGPLTDEQVKEIMSHLDDLSDWKYDIKDVKLIVKQEKQIQEEFEKKFAKLEKMIDDLEEPSKLSKVKLECDILLEAIECCYVTLGSNYTDYTDRLDELTEGFC